MRIGLVTCVCLPEPDPDADLLLQAIAAHAEVEWIAWDAENGDLSRFDCCVLRSTWNYYQEPAAFRSWIDHAAAVTRLFNPPSVVHWNLHKRYLLELNVPTVPTVLVGRGEPVPSLDLFDRGRTRRRSEERAEWETDQSDRIVIKPAVSASSFATRFFDHKEEAASYLAQLVAERDVLIQPFVPSVMDRGERALVWIAGRATHAVRKSPRFAGEDEQVELVSITDEERSFCEAAIACAPDSDRLLYGRVDVVLDENGDLRVAELELIEPSLFLEQSEEAQDRLVSAILNRADSCTKS